MSLSAVVVAAGRSERFQKDLVGSSKRSKLAIEWDGLPLIVHTLRALEALPLSELCLVVREDEREWYEGLLTHHLPARSFTIQFALGGRRRQDSVRNGLQGLRSPYEKVFIHDGARPFLSRSFLETLWLRAQQVDAVIPVSPVFETLKEVRADGSIVRTVDRKSFVRVQTPQFFSRDLILKAHETFAQSETEFTDDAAMVEALGATVWTVEGASENIKVTVPEDLRLRGIHV